MSTDISSVISCSILIIKLESALPCFTYLEGRVCLSVKEMRNARSKGLATKAEKYILSTLILSIDIRDCIHKTYE